MGCFGGVGAFGCGGFAGGEFLEEAVPGEEAGEGEAGESGAGLPEEFPAGAVTEVPVGL